ncbi:hypothetical protein JD844_010215, partial [Phrynosoma platyrhinos]
HPGQTHSVQSQNKQNWLIVERRNLTQGDNYSVWMEVCSAAGNITSKKLNFSLDDIAPVGQVDVWREVGLSENGNPNILLLWKALDPEAARGDILDYDVTYRDHSKNIYKMLCHCCNATLPHTAVYAWVTARNSIKNTPPANLSLEQTGKEHPGPEEVQVMAIPGLGLNVTWKPSMSPQWIQPEEYVVEWREEFLGNKGGPLNWIRRPSSSNSAQLRGDFRPKIPYRVGVYALYAEGSSTSATVQAYFKEEVPSASPQVLQVRSISSTASHISWKEIPLESRNGFITHYTLYLKHSSSGNITRMPIGATESSYKLLNLMPGTAYQLWMTGSNSAGEGVSSLPHHFSTPVSHWQIIVMITVVVGVLLILAAILIYVKHRWVLGFCHKILPPWCWERVPDPGHSMVASKINEQNAAHGMVRSHRIDHLSLLIPLKKEQEDTLCQYLDQSPKGTDIVEIEEPAPELLPPPPPAPVVNSGYEKHFMPTREEMQKLS